MDPDSSTAQPDNTAPVSSPNDLSTEMTAEEEQAFVNETLGIKGVKDEPSTSEPTPTGDTTAGEAETPAVTPEAEPVVPATPEAPAVTPEPTKPETPEPATELTAPQTDDLWIEVKDSEGKDVKLVFDPKNPASFLPTDFTFKDDAQLFQILDAKNEMTNLYKTRLAEFETKTEAQKAEEAVAKSNADTQAAWDAEIQDLISGGLLEAPKVSDPKDPKFMEDPTVAKVDAVFKFMATENVARKEAGTPLLRSFGTAFNLFTAKQTAQAEADETKKQNDLAKKRGALVGGTSSPSVSSDKPIYKSGSAHSIFDVPIPD